MALINNGQILGSGSTDLILNTRGKIYVKVGDRFYELDFKNEGNNKGSSIINNTTINNPEQDLSPYVTKKYLKAALGEYVTKRNWEDIMQTKDALENAKLEGFTESITPITVNTMQMVVGTQNLQFDFIASLTDDTVVSPGLYINESGQLVCPKGVIKHYTLFGPQSIKPETNIEYYARWAINGDDSGDYTLLDLEEKDKPYYVYLRVNTTGYKDITDDDVTQNLVDDPKGKNTGNWFASTQSYAIDEVEGYAYLLVALVTGSNAGGRSIGYLNGFTEILPGQITAYVFKTADGNQYLDFLNKRFKIGDDATGYLKWDIENGLELKGKLSVTGGELQDTLDKLQSSTTDMEYITNAIKKGKTEVDGGLILSNMLLLGNPEIDGNTAGISGISNDKNDVAFWGGGTYAQASAAVQKYADNPSYIPTEEELASMAKIVITHGGRAILNDAIFRGIVYASGGNFNGEINSTSGNIGGFTIGGDWLEAQMKDNSGALRSTNNLSAASAQLSSHQFINGVQTSAIRSLYPSVTANSFSADTVKVKGDTQGKNDPLYAYYADVTNAKNNYAFFAEHGAFGGLKPKTIVVGSSPESSSSYDLSNAQYAYNIYINTSNNYTLTLPSEPEEGETHRVIKHTKSGELTVKVGNTATQSINKFGHAASNTAIFNKGQVMAEYIYIGSGVWSQIVYYSN